MGEVVSDLQHLAAAPIQPLQHLQCVCGVCFLDERLMSALVCGMPKSNVDSSPAKQLQLAIAYAMHADEAMALIMYCSHLQRRFDHHCLLVGNCIGNDNHRFFAGEVIHYSTHTSIALHKLWHSNVCLCTFCSLPHGAASLLRDPGYGGVAKAAHAFHQVRLADTNNSKTVRPASMCLPPCTSAPNLLVCSDSHDLYASGTGKHGSGPAHTCCWAWTAFMYIPACFCYLAAGAHWRPASQ
jgi:DHHC palmitoyltransferase